MSSTVELNINENCNLYDLYISSKLRCSTIIDMSINNYSPKRLNILGDAYKHNSNKYEKLLRNTQKIFENKKMIFMGTSNNEFVGIKGGQIILNFVNLYLDSYRSGLKVRRIVLTDEIGEKDSPKCYPLLNIRGKIYKYKHMPFTSPSVNSLNWEPHLAVYSVNMPEKDFYPKLSTKVIV